MAGSHVIGLGAGTIILLVLWTVTALIWIVLHRSQSILRHIMTLVSTVTTLILFVLPPETDEDVHPPRYSRDEDIIYDYFFILKAILIMILIMCLLAGMALSISEYWTMKVHGHEAVPRRQPKELSIQGISSSLENLNM